MRFVIHCTEVQQRQIKGVEVKPLFKSSQQLYRQNNNRSYGCRVSLVQDFCLLDSMVTQVTDPSQQNV